MLTDKERRRLAAETIAEMVEDPKMASVLARVCEDFSFMENGEPEPVYGATSEDGYGSYSCDYWPMAAVEKLTEECERMYDEFTIRRTEGGAVAETRRLDELPKSFNDKYRPEILGWMRKMAVNNLFVNMRSRLNFALWLNFEESKLVAQGLLASTMASLLARLYEDEPRADARASIAELVGKVTEEEKRHLMQIHARLPRVTLEGRRGPKAVTDAGVRRALRALGADASKAKVAAHLGREESAVKRWLSGSKWKTWAEAKRGLLERRPTGAN